MITKKFFSLVLLLSALELDAQKTLTIDKQEYSCATSFNIAVRTKNISNVVALQGSLAWDTNVIRYNTISFGTSAISFNASNVNVTDAVNGHLTYLWFDDNVQGRTVADSTPLFTINFITNGTGKGKGNIDFSNTPTPLEIDTLDNNSIPANDLTAVFKNGYVVTPSFYYFTGNGNWSVAANWNNNLIPPSVLPACSEIFINPAGSNTCLLDIQQTIAPGAKLTVNNGKKLIVPGNINIQ